MTPLSCVKCGAPRTPSVCAYCGTKYSSPQPLPAFSTDLADLGDRIGKSMTARGVLRTGFGLSVLVPRRTVVIEG